MEILEFKIWWPFGHFRKHYTTTSPLTHTIPPFTAIKGMLACIIGLSKDTYNESFNDIKIGVVLENRVGKKIFGMNYSDTSKRIWDTAIQVKMETLVNPSYSIFVSSENFPEYGQLRDSIKSGQSSYTPCLWIAQFLASVRYSGEYDVGETTAENVVIDSVIPKESMDSGRNVILRSGDFFEFDKSPRSLDNSRGALALQEVVFNGNMNGIRLKTAKFHVCGNRNVVLW